MRVTLGTWGARTALGAVVFSVAAFLPVTGAAAQDRMVYVIDGGGAGRDFDMRTVQRGFNLFGQVDAALSGLRATGNFGTSISNYGDCNGTLLNCQNNRVNNPDGGTDSPYFEVEWAYGVPPSQFVRIRNVAPSVANATGGGWMAAYNQTVLGLPKRFGPHDATLGRMFSGVTGTTDGSCRDHTGFPNGDFFGGGDNSAGLQILPASDCPATWGSDGWQGSHPIDLDGYKALFDQQGDNFVWDFWRVPEANQRIDKMFMGTRHHTYGETSDYGSDVLANYGSVIPGGAGTPVHQGYPLGLLIHFEAFNFAVPTVASAYLVQAMIINRSEDVWGAPVDYDSLYFGLSMGGLFSSQNHSVYSVPQLGAAIYHNSGVLGGAGPCGETFRQAYPGGCSNRGYQDGSTAIMFLKSPIGDLRNKLFTRTLAGAPCAIGVDPFCNPQHPLAGDTITFMRQTYGDYGYTEGYTWGTSTRAAFGLLSATEGNTLDGRNPGDANDRTLYNTFRSELWPATKVHYNKYVPPGGWDYNHDEVPDTLQLDTCGQFGCVAVDSDTMPGGWLNKRGNIGGLQSFGPFSLAARDTTSIIYAHIGEPDQAQLFATIQAVSDLYLNFYLSPEAPPPVRVASTQVVPGTDALGTANPQVQIFFSDDPERWVDPFLTKAADDVENAAPGTPLALLRELNNGRDITILQIDTVTTTPLETDTTVVGVFPSSDLVSALRDRAGDNLHRLEVYKSCNGGATFTADGDCDPDQANRSGGQADVFGWRTYAEFDMDAGGGDIPNLFTDGNVDGGRTYLYVFVAKSRGASFLLNTENGEEVITFAPPIWNPLSRSTSDPNVVSVYVPASKPAGYRSAVATFTSLPTATVPFVPNLSDNVVSTAYRAVFGNEILVERDSSISAGEAVRSFVTIRRRETVDAAGVATDSLISAELFTYLSSEVFLVAGSGTEGTPTNPAPDTIRTPTLYTGLGFVLASGSSPVFASQTLTGDAATPTTLFGRPEFPGFTITADNDVAGDHNADYEAQVRGPTSIGEQRLLPSDSIVPRGVVNANSVQWMETEADPTADAGGRYHITWADDAFGVERGFVPNLTNPGATEAEVQATLAVRQVATTGLTDAATAALLGEDQTNLVPVKLPFTIRNITFDRPVDVAMVRRFNNLIQLGNGADTISVAVQEDQWVPGDALVFIEDVVDDSSTANGLVLDASGQPVPATRRAVTFNTAVLGCQTTRLSCNPVDFTARGATGYLPFRAEDVTRFSYYVGFSPSTRYAFDLTAPITGDQITAVTDSALSLIRVVPNPYVIFSQYQTTAAEGRLLFTNLPSHGTLRIYTIAGQLVQQITWVPADLMGDGDLFWNMRTREGLDIASGLYLWVLTAPTDPSNPGSTPIQARGKFVVIRGDSQ